MFSCVPVVRMWECGATSQKSSVSCVEPERRQFHHLSEDRAAEKVYDGSTAEQQHHSLQSVRRGELRSNICEHDKLLMKFVRPVLRTT